MPDMQAFTINDFLFWASMVFIGLIIIFIRPKNKHGQNKERGYDFGYRPRDIWYRRLDSVENLAKDDKLKITSEILSGLGKIVEMDRDHRIRGLAKSLLKSYESKGDFSDTRPSKEKKAEEKRLALPIISDGDYDVKDIWYDRLKSLVRLAETKCCDASNKVLIDLFTIMKGDDDWRIRELAFQMLNSYSERGDFSDTYPYREKRAEEKRLALPITACWGYNVKDIWYDRRMAIERFKGCRNIPSNILNDLKTISRGDDDWRIRELATEICRC